jgi:hypothetical protein
MNQHQECIYIDEFRFQIGTNDTLVERLAVNGRRE